MGFTKITVEVLLQNPSLAEYLRRAEIKPAQRGGTFVGSREVASNDFRKYGIVLPRGGMIIPYMDSEQFREVVLTPGRLREAEDQKLRRKAEQLFHEKVKNLIVKYKIDDLQIVGKEGEESRPLRNSPWHKSFLLRGEEVVFELHTEQEPVRDWNDYKLFKPWWVDYTPLEKVEGFLQEEVRLFDPRKLFAERITRLVSMSHALGQKAVGEDNWARPRVELFLYEDYSKETDWCFFAHRCKSVFSAHRVMYRNKLYELNQENIALLESEVGRRADQARLRQEMLKKLFFEQNGEFTFEARNYEALESGRSFATGRTKDSSWTERHYFLGQEEVTREEYEWLNNFLPEIKVPDGFVRVANDTNELLPILEIPGSKDIIVIEGKMDSHGGVCRYGEWFRGHPLKCQISFGHKGTLNRIKSMTLNGEPVEAKFFDLDKWNKPTRMAEWALKLAGIELTNERKDALASAYEKMKK